MLTDAHCHPYDLVKVFPGMEEERRRLGVLCAASSSSREEFEYAEIFSRTAQAECAAGIFPCFAIHPQLPAYINSQQEHSHQIGENPLESNIAAGLALLEELAGQGRLAAVGETGFDLFNAQFRETEAVQEKIFAFHVELALHFDLPLVLHVRRALHKIFAFSEKLKKCRAVVFHSWPGTPDEAQALLSRGINAFFSFGTPIVLNHHRAMNSCAVLPADRLLIETDAPYQPLRDPARRYSSWEDLPAILNAAAALRRQAGSPAADDAELEKIIETNFRSVYSVPRLTTE